MSHTFASLPHIPYKSSYPEDVREREELVEGSIIDQVSLFPHNSFSVHPGNNEREKTINSPFMSLTLASIPSPLNRLTLLIYELKKGPNPISLPFNPPIAGITNLPYTLDKILGTANYYCDKVSVYDPDPNGKSVWKTTKCGPKLSETYVVAGETFVVYMNKDKRLLVHGVVPEKLPAIQLKKGWNYVGPPWVKYSETPDQSFAQFRNKINAVYYFDNIQNKWLKYVPSIFSLIPNNSDLKIIESGKAYFIDMKEDAIWAPKGYKDGNIITPQQTGGFSSTLPTQELGF
ncbi:hypothetical protein HYT02_00825 [Candidatus Gottesmanbacteria bacterium]|nr:hypothetical protein [Candidatus Gottesmanbacteria bacterium]